MIVFLPVKCVFNLSSENRETFFLTYGDSN